MRTNREEILRPSKAIIVQNARIRGASVACCRLTKHRKATARVMAQEGGSAVIGPRERGGRRQGGV